MSTSSGQVALAQGYLQREWEQDGRRYYHYKSEAQLLPFFSRLSADWQVARDRWNDVAIEVYHHPAHAWNAEDDRLDQEVAGLLHPALLALPVRGFRILEFPGYQQFAQAFAGTIPYSESIGFIADLRDREDIDYRVLRHRARPRTSGGRTRSSAPAMRARPCCPNRWPSIRR